jgi:inhibitor of KinA sporulation pathway (predicted exonuclease)
MYYQPTVYVWGKNDILMLNSFYEKYKLKPLVERQKIVNLMQVMKNYYNIKTDIGLFNAYHLFGRSPVEEQDHNALHDAVATAEVFKLFQKEIS